jgi:hypothetical protein
VGLVMAAMRTTVLHQEMLMPQDLASHLALPVALETGHLLVLEVSPEVVLPLKVALLLLKVLLPLLKVALLLLKAALLPRLAVQSP